MTFIRLVIFAILVSFVSGLSQSEIGFEIIKESKSFYNFTNATETSIKNYLEKSKVIGFEKVLKEIDEAENEKVQASIEFLNNVYIPLIDVMRDIIRESSFDCW